MFKAVAVEDLLQGADLGDAGADHAREVAGYTLIWLEETGYMHKRGECYPFRFTLSPKAFHILVASPFSTREMDEPPAPKAKEPTLGDQLKALTKDTLTSEGKDRLKALVHWAISGGIAYATAKAQGL